MASSANTSLALVAGELSGDLLAARLMAGLKPHLPDVAFSGIGGPRMLEQGLVSDVPMDTLTVRGLLPVLLRYRELKGIQNRLRDRLLAERPAAFIGADYPGFNLGLEEQLKSAGIPTDITENSIRDYALANEWVDIKVCAVSELWSGLKLVIPVAKR